MSSRRVLVQKLERACLKHPRCLCNTCTTQVVQVMALLSLKLNKYAQMFCIMLPLTRGREHRRISPARLEPLLSPALGLPSPPLTPLRHTIHNKDVHNPCLLIYDRDLVAAGAT